MSGKLDQSLDTIMTERRRSARTRRPRRAAAAKAGPTAPVGGVKKTTKPAKTAEKIATPAASLGSGDSKIIVSNLPHDVVEAQIKDYFTQTVGAVKRVLLSYGPNGQSRGVATIIFQKPDSAAKAAKDLDGIKVDNRPMKIEVILGAKDAPVPTAPKSLKDRIAQPKPAAKAQPKPATAVKANATKKGGRKPRGGRGRNPGRGKPKTAEELDAEMVDYWDGGANPTAAGDTAMGNGGAVQPTANADAGMEDEIM